MSHRRTIITVSVIAVVGCFCAALLLVTYQGFTLAVWWRLRGSGNVLWHGPADSREVALTFDDGPDPTNTPRILAILKQANIHATFFETGRMLRSHSSVGRDVLAAGNEIGNHTETHPHLDLLPARAVHDEIAGGEEAIEAVLHIRSSLFRPPRGDWNPTIYSEAVAAGDRIILWSYAVEHSDATSVQAMIDRAVRLARPGAILLMHDGGHRNSTVLALPEIIRQLRAAGYRFVTVSQLLGVPGDEPLKPLDARAVTGRHSIVRSR